MTTVIRAGAGPTVHTRLKPIDLRDHLEEARRLVEDARVEAERLRSDAQTDVDRIHRETRESGYEEGYRLGETDGRKDGFTAAHKEASEEFEREHADLVSDMRRVVDELDRMKSDLEHEARAGLLRFAVETAQRLTFAIGSLNSESAMANLDRAIDLLGTRLDVTVRANGRDMAALRTFAAGVMDRVGQSRTMRFVEDDSVAPGGCIVESESSRVDASLETQAEAIVSLLVGKNETSGAAHEYAVEEAGNER